MDVKKIKKVIYESLDDEIYWGRKITTEQIINITLAQVKKLGRRKKT